MIIVATPDAVIDSKDRALWLTGPFDLDLSPPPLPFTLCADADVFALYDATVEVEVC